MSILAAEQLTKYYGAQDIFSNLSFQISHGERIALVGVNGVGKTTLLRIISGLESPDSGRLSKAKSLRIGYLSQRADLGSGRTLYEEMAEIFAHLRAQQAQLHQLEREMADPESRATVMRRYGELLQRFELAGGYAYEHEIRRVLMGLGFAEADFSKLPAVLSGGQRTRAQLAKLLLAKPDLLLLDEPTNHLDLEAIRWLEDYLGQWKGSLLIVAHDRYFLDKVANRVWEMSFGALEQYRGRYSHYVELRFERRARRQAEYDAQQEHIARTKDFIRRYKAGQRAREARGRQKRLDRLERLQRPREQRTIQFALSSKTRGGNDVLATGGLEIGYDQPLIECPDLLLLRQERVALLGPNGCGKTTFLKTVLGEVPPLAGQVRIGANVHLAYLAQGHEDLDENSTVLDEILKVENLALEKARGFLGRFLFSGDDVFKPIADLSGGERGRVTLAKLALRGANFLLLDEPTNYLDIESQELLERVLLDFDGTIVFVSHNRYFIDALATQMWVVDNGQLRVYPGNYSAYLEQVNEQEAQAEARPRTRETQNKRQGERRRAQTRKPAQLRQTTQAALETDIHQLETRLSVLARELELASLRQQVNRLYDLGQEYQDVQQRLEQRLTEWSGVAPSD
ncbi:MAG TPA: ATP-binding cassette domain-containing protein [Anaerolineae bacterium]|nr:ATP-binding cassette domain-containing protein [Anaerolineae bacterium]